MKAYRSLGLSILVFVMSLLNLADAAPTPSGRQACEDKCWVDYAASTQTAASEQDCCSQNSGSWIPLLGCYILDEDDQTSFRACRSQLQAAQSTLNNCIRKCRGSLNISIITLAQ